MEVLSEEMIQMLVCKAQRMLSRSYSPYSGFAVGAALLAKNGTVYTGCNIENASFPAGICAERTAFVKAVSEGVTDFEAIAIVGGKGGIVTEFCSPCGICRQVFMEFCDPDSFRIILADGSGAVEIYTLKELLPLGFGPQNL